MSRRISSDPFSRESLHSVRVYVNRPCSWCGRENALISTGGRAFLIRYHVESDSSRGPIRNPVNGLFCGIACARDYHQGAL